MKKLFVAIFLVALVFLSFLKGSKANEDPCTQPISTVEPAPSSQELAMEELEAPVEETIEYPLTVDDPLTEEENAPESPAETPPEDISTESTGTTEPQPVIGHQPQILINEVSFKDPDKDFIELFVLNDGNSGNGTNLQNYTLEDDQIFKTLPSINVKTADLLLLYFNSKNETDILQQNNIVTLFTSKTGLTSTTEQVILRDQNKKLLDAVCWTSTTPTASEQKDFQIMFNESGWNGSDISSCIASEQIKEKASIGRTVTQDTNSKADWITFASSTPGKPNVVETANTTQSSSTTQNSASTTSENSTASTTISVTTSTSAIPKIIINEIFPNPEGDDTQSEWIELKNLENSELNLDNFTLDDEEGGSTPFLIKNIQIPAQGFALFTIQITKLQLNNTKDAVRLFSPQKELIDAVTYENAPSGQTYAKTESNTWKWSSKPTPLQPNMFEVAAIEEAKTSVQAKGIKVTTKKTPAKTLKASTVKKKAKQSPEKVSKQAKKQTKKQIAYKDGDFSDEISITEIFPNPKGKDEDKEWIEIYNASNENVNLGNWKLDDDIKGSKPYVLPDTLSIKAGEFFVISSKNSHLRLGNKGDKARLFDPENILIDEVKWTESKENMSYAKVSIIANSTHSQTSLLSIAFAGTSKTKWEWIDQPTPGIKNPIFEILEGKIKLEKDSNKTIPQFQLESNSQRINVEIPKNMPSQLTNLLLEPDAEVRLLAEKKENNYRLHSFEVLNKTSPSFSTTYSLQPIKWFSIIALLLILAYVFHKTILKQMPHL